MKNLIGKKVRMNESFKKLEGVQENVAEFGDCTGTVEGLVDYGDCLGPEVDVRWEPDGLRYAYHPNELEILE
jgi:hypothetical protein